MAQFCPELQRVLSAELQAGNSFSDGPYQADWPAHGSVFGSLEKDFSAGKRVAGSVKFAVDNDPHYGWYESCFCPVNKHMLVAGECRLEESSY
ncbi:MAG: hypothetical protein Q4D85_07675 [Corynebacterium sp.]|uniref:hypothetical protein n=1 Tax=Corynebacterium sp. TaxID=1720 RepID=UPI0026DAE73A|nr:hypothetical protein [Corynebacterium sp.]MDO5098625.1 hypothetical protein [Corynebacterium sp.]